MSVIASVTESAAAPAWSSSMSSGVDIGLSEVLLFFSFLAGYFFFQSQTVIQFLANLKKSRQQLDSAQHKLADDDDEEEIEEMTISQPEEIDQPQDQDQDKLGLLKSGLTPLSLSAAAKHRRTENMSTDEGSEVDASDASPAAATFGSSDEDGCAMDVDDDDDDAAESPVVRAWRRSQEARHSQTRLEEAELSATHTRSVNLPLLSRVPAAPAPSKRVPPIDAACPISPKRPTRLPSPMGDAEAASPFEHFAKGFFSSSAQQQARAQPKLSLSVASKTLDAAEAAQAQGKEELALLLSGEGCREEESAAAWRLVTLLQEKTMSVHAVLGAVVRAVHMAAESGDGKDAQCACTLVAAVMEMSSEVEEGLLVSRTLASLVEADLEDSLDDANPPDMAAAARLAAEGINARLFHPARSARFADMLLSRCELVALSAYLEALSPSFRKYIATAAQAAATRAGTPFVPDVLRQRLQAAAAAHSE